MGAPVSRDVYHQFVTQHAGSTSTLPVHPKGGSTRHVDSSKLVNSTLFATDPTLVAVDFQAIADSSTGGAYCGLPRPYGRFQAHRAGDGLAQFERVPPARVQQWHAKLAGGEELAVSASAAGSTGSGAPSPKGQEQGAGADLAPPSHSSSTQHSPPALLPVLPGAHPRAHGSQGGARSPTRGITTPSLVGPPARFARPETTAGSRGSGRSDSAPPAPTFQHSSWFQLPAATFLTRVPGTLPLAGIRMDCGTGTARDFLMSGLHHAPPKAHAPMADAATDTGPGAAAVERQVSAATVGAAGPAGGATAPRSVSPPGYRAVRVSAHDPALYLPVDARTDDAVRSTLGLQGATQGHVPAIPPSTAVLEAISEARKPIPTTAAAPELATATRRLTSLPPEQHLPRRLVPAVGR